jgi:hypothetical protein
MVGAMAVLLCVPAAAPAAGLLDPAAPPPLCAGTAFADQLGTAGSDWLEGARRPERLWGFGGPDDLTGSPTRASCLIGGADADALRLGAGGGTAFGEPGADVVTGGPLDDHLSGGPGPDELAGGGGADTIDGGTGRDMITAGGGDDVIDAIDGRGEIVDCGAGRDLVSADRFDALMGCEQASLSGRPAVRAVPGLARGGRADIVRVRFRVPKTAAAGAYRVILLDGPCLAPGAHLARVGAQVNRGRQVRIGLRPPASGWCTGVYRAAVVLDGRHPVVRLGYVVSG